MYIKEEKLKELLLNSDLITEKVFEDAKAEAFRSGQKIADVLVGREEISEDFLLELLAPYFNVPIINLKKVIIPAEALGLLPEAFVKSNSAVIFEYNQAAKTAKIAMLNPLDLEIINFIRAKYDLRLDVY